MNTATQSVGKSLNRVDGRLKVTGAARYSAEHQVENLAYGILVKSTIVKGKIKEIETIAAKAVPGVLEIITHENTPKFGALPEYIQPLDPVFAAQSHLPMQSANIDHNGQHIAVVVADTLENAEYAASLIKVSYEEESAVSSFADALAQGFEAGTPHEWASCLPKAFKPHDIIGDKPDDKRGDVDAGFTEADIVIDETYTTPTHHHNPMEPHSTTAVWQGEQLTVYDSSNAVFGAQRVLATTLQIPVSNIRVIAPFVGGSFGCKGRVWPHVILAAVAARKVGRPVKLTLTRQQMYSSTGHRPPMVQHLRLGATRDGKLTAIAHDTTEETWQFETYAEPTGAISRMMYACPNFSMTHRVIKVNTPKANMMHVPGEGIGSFALECGMDELAYKLNIDPIELRLRNYADVDPQDNRPWSSKSLKECYQVGAEKFGWSKRNSKPGSMRSNDGKLIGYGMASASYPCFYRQPATATGRLFADGSVLIQSGTSEQGCGTYTVMVQVAADELGIIPEKIRFELGDTNLSHAPQSVASMTVNSVAPAVKAVCEKLRNQIVEMAIADEKSPLHKRKPEEIAVGDGRLFLTNDSEVGETYEDILARQGSPFARLSEIEATGVAAPGEEVMKYSMHSFGAMFAEVSIDPDLCEARVTRFVSAIAAGKILNPKTARNQINGGIIWGISHTLSEESLMDGNFGRYMNANLGEYHIAVNADIPNIDVHFLDETDSYVNPTGTKSVGEISKVGVIAAIANAIYHATGKRVRDLPITLDKLL